MVSALQVQAFVHSKPAGMGWVWPGFRWERQAAALGLPAPARGPRLVTGRGGAGQW